jgi:ATP-binding cassette subfamily B protein/subfamily B ATP-binding cassette protein MsbA
MSLWSKIRRVLPYVLAERRSLALILVLSALSSIVAIAAPWPLKILVDVALEQGAVEGWLAATGIGSSSAATLAFICAGATVLIGVTASLLGNALAWLWTAAGHRMLYALAGDLFAHVQRMSLLFHVRQSVGDLLSRITGDTWCVYSLTAQLLVSPIVEIVMILGVGATAVALDPQLTALIFILAPLMVLSVKYLGDPIQEKSHGQREAEAALASFSQQTLSNIPLVQVFGLALRNARVFEVLGMNLVRSAQSLVVAGDGYALVNGAVLSAGSAIVLFFGAQRVLAGELTVGSLLVFMAYVGSLQGAIGGLLESYGQVRAIEASIDRVTSVLDKRSNVQERPDARPLTLQGRTGARIEFDAVRFAYDAVHPALHDINLEIAPGTTFALVGPTGAGKSTLAGLIPRFFDPQAGEVRIDGQRLTDVSLRSIRDCVSIVLQEPFLLPLSIAENIAFGRRDATRNDVEAAACAANADEFIRRLPDGYDTVLGERGAMLSGGERQRISIARAIARDAPILILDEPTSAVDPETEGLILEALSRLIEGRTTLIIAHRLSTVESADQIGFLEDGTLVELGTRDALLVRRGRFWRFAQLQQISRDGARTG